MISFPELQTKTVSNSSNSQNLLQTVELDKKESKSNFQDILTQTSKTLADEKPIGHSEPLANSPEKERINEKSKSGSEPENTKQISENQDEKEEIAQKEEDSSLEETNKAKTTGKLQELVRLDEDLEMELVEGEDEESVASMNHLSMISLIFNEKTEVKEEVKQTLGAILKEQNLEKPIEQPQKGSSELSPMENKWNPKEKSMDQISKKIDFLDKKNAEKKQSSESILFNEFKTLEKPELFQEKVESKTKEGSVKNLSKTKLEITEKTEPKANETLKETREERNASKSLLLDNLRISREPRDQNVQDRLKKMEVSVTKEINFQTEKSSSESGSFSGSHSQSGKNDDNGFLNVFQKDAKLASKEVVQQNTNLAKESNANFQKNLQEMVKSAQFHIVENGKNSARIELNPKDLGKMTLQITQDKNQVDGKIFVETEMAKSLLESEISNLKSELKTIGLELENLVIDVNIDDSHKQAFFDWEKTKNEGSSRSRSENSGLDLDSEGNESGEYQKDPSKLVDIRIY